MMENTNCAFLRAIVFAGATATVVEAFGSGGFATFFQATAQLHTSHNQNQYSDATGGASSFYDDASAFETELNVIGGGCQTDSVESIIKGGGFPVPFCPSFQQINTAILMALGNESVASLALFDETISIDDATESNEFFFNLNSNDTDFGIANSTSPSNMYDDYGCKIQIVTNLTVDTVSNVTNENDSDMGTNLTEGELLDLMDEMFGTNSSNNTNATDEEMDAFVNDMFETDSSNFTNATNAMFGTNSSNITNATEGGDMFASNASNSSTDLNGTGTNETAAAVLGDLFSGLSGASSTATSSPSGSPSLSPSLFPPTGSPTSAPTNSPKFDTFVSNVIGERSDPECIANRVAQVVSLRSSYDARSDEASVSSVEFAFAVLGVIMGGVIFVCALLIFMRSDRKGGGKNKGASKKGGNSKRDDDEETGDSDGSDDESDDGSEDESGDESDYDSDES